MKRSEDEENIDIALSGTSATLVIQTAKRLYLAWVGDSQVVLGRRDKKAKATILTPEHSPKVESEKIRIYNNRGETRTSLDSKVRIYVRARMYPGLSISRSLGDILGHHIGVTSEPKVKIQNIDPSDKVLAMATDGVWDVLSADEVIEIINDYGMREPGTSSEIICTKVRDMCTVIISFLAQTAI